MHTNLHSEIYPSLKERRRQKIYEKLVILSVITAVLIAIALFYYDWNYPREAIPQVHAQVMKQLSVKYWAIKSNLHE